MSDNTTSQTLWLREFLRTRSERQSHFRCFLARASCVCVGLALTASVQADLIPLDLAFGGQYQYDTTSSEVFDSGTQSGTLIAREGGVDTVLNYSDNTAGSPNPLNAVFTEHGGGVDGSGDGFGGSGSALAGETEGYFRSDTDQTAADGVTPFTVTNLSLSQAYRISMLLSYDHWVNAEGFDAGLRSDLEFNLDGASLLDAEIISDTQFGNELNGQPIPGFGGRVSDSGLYHFDFMLTPGQSAEMDLDYTFEGAAFPGGLSVAEGESAYFLSINDIQTVPAPSVFWTFGAGLGLLALAGVRRRYPHACKIQATGRRFLNSIL